MTDPHPTPSDAPSDAGHIGRMQMDLPGLLALTSQALYSEPEIAFRELAQNAHDAIVRRRTTSEHPESCPPGTLVIRFEEAAGRRYITFDDNGAGLSADEAREFLATIGRGQTGQDRADTSRSDTGDLVGQFGVGLLAAFLVADRVEVESRRFDLPEDAGVRWVNEGKQTYRLERAERREAGTRVRLRAREDMAHLATEGAVRRALERWARYLDLRMLFPSGEGAGGGVLPWRHHEGSPALREGLEAALAADLGEARPSASVRLVPFEHEGRRVELHGLVVFRERASSGSAGGTAQVLVRRMTVERENRTLLPTWASMTLALIECADLSPTASREAVRRDALHDAVAVAIERQLLDGLRDLGRTDPARLRALATVHRDVLLRETSQHTALFDLFADELLVHTTRGTLTVSACLSEGDGVLRYYRDGGDLATVSVLATGSGWVVIDARAQVVSSFLGMYLTRRGVPSQLFDPRSHSRPLQHVSPELRRLETWATTADVRAELRELEPPALPALVVEDWDAFHRRRAHDALARPETTPAVRDLLRDLSVRAPTDPTTLLLLNASNPLVRRLAQLEDHTRARAALSTLALQARLLGERRPQGAETLALYEELSQALETLALGAG